MKEFNFDFENFTTSVLNKNQAAIVEILERAFKEDNGDDSLPLMVSKLNAETFKLSIDIASFMLEKYHEELTHYLDANFVRKTE